MPFNIIPSGINYGTGNLGFNQTPPPNLGYFN